jgi:Ig-like domain from next to BRCA1 gene
MNLFRRSLIPILLIALVLSACGGAPATEAAQLDFILTEGVKTMVAAYFETQTALAPVATATIPATITPSPAFTPVGFLGTQPPTLTPTFLYYPTSIPFTSTVTGTPPTATLTSGGFGCNNLALLYEIYPNGSNVLKPGESFFMTWKVHNSGTCEWKSYYRLSFVSGTDMDPRVGNLGKIIPVDKNPEISVQMDAPNRTGSFTAYFRMSDGNGNLFGSTLPVTIKVQGDPTNTPVTPPATPVTPPVTPETPSTITTP